MVLQIPCTEQAKFAGYVPNNPADTSRMLSENPKACQDCKDFLGRLKRYLQYQKAGLGTYTLVIEMLTACAHGQISSRQMLTSLRNILREHPKVLEAISHLLGQLHFYMNLVRFHLMPCVVAPTNHTHHVASLIMLPHSSCCLLKCMCTPTCTVGLRMCQPR
jgi:hypothetical protein